MKKIIISIMIAMLLSSIVVANNDYHNFADELNELGLFKGTSKGYELDGAPTRTVGAIMLIRLLGKEEEALNGSYTHPFTDVPSWADKYIGYMYEKGLTKGISANQFGANKLLNVKSYMTFVLRALGYDDAKGDFSVATSLELGMNLNLMTPSEKSTIENSGFLRGNMVLISRMALLAEIKGSNKTLQDKLYLESAITQKINGQEYSSDMNSDLRVKWDNNTGCYGYVDRNMNWVISAKYSMAKEFSEGLAFIIEEEGGYRSYITTEGEYAFDEQYLSGTDFKNGKAVVRLYGIKEEEQKICIINTEGKILKNLQISYSLRENDDHDGLIYYSFMENGKYTYYYFTSNRKFIDYPMDEITKLHDDVAIIYPINTQFNTGLLNINTGKIVTTFDDASGQSYPFQRVEFSEGIFRAEFKKDKKDYYVFYNSDLEPIIHQAFRRAGHFSEGVAAVGVKKYEDDVDSSIRLGYLNKDGSWFKVPQYVEASPFKDGIATVRHFFSCGVLSRDGTYTVQLASPDLFEGMMTQEEYDYAYSEADKVIKNIITNSMSDLEKVKAINKYVVEQTKYDNNYSPLISTIPRVSFTPYGVFKYGIAVCQGYAYTTNILLDKAGIENEYISGTTVYANGTKEGHGWNLVKVDGSYYHLDVTWNDGNAHVNGFFLVSDDYMKKAGMREWNYASYPEVPNGYYNDKQQPRDE